MIIHIPLDKIAPNPWQTRLAAGDEHIRNLAFDIRQNGLMQYPVGRLVYRSDGQLVDWSNDLIQQAQQPNTCVQLAFGHNRLAAYRLLAGEGDANLAAAFATLPVEIRILSNETMAIMAWSENEKRRDHTPIERARAIQRRLADFGWSHDQIAEKLGVSRSTVSNALRLLKLPTGLQDDLQRAVITERQAFALLPLFDLDPQLVEIHKFGDSVDLLISLAREGYSSEDLRSRVSQAVDWFNSLVQPSLIQPPAPSEPEPDEPPTPIQPEAPEPLQPDVDSTWPPATEPPAQPDETPEPTQPDSLAERFEAAMATRQAINAPTAKPAPRPQAPSPQPPAPPDPPAPPPDWPHSTVVVTITLLPEDSHHDGRPVMLGLRANNSGAPLMRMCRQADLALGEGVILQALADIQNQIEGE